MAQSRFSRNSGAVMLVGFIVLLLGVVFYAFPPWQVAADGADKARHDSMAQLPVALWWLGSGILAAALIYGTLSSRRRSPSEERLSEDATKRNYTEEDGQDRLYRDAEEFKPVKGMPE
jgi:hypothetical protein